MKRSVFAFDCVALSTREMILAALDSPALRVARITREPSVLMDPARTSLPGSDAPRNGLTRQRGSVHEPAPREHQAVQGDPLAGAHRNLFTHGDLLWLHFQESVAAAHPGDIRAKLQEPADGPPAPVHRDILQDLPHLVEDHHGDRFPELMDCKGARRCHGHQEVLVENPAVDDAAERSGQDVPPRQQVGSAENRVFEPWPRRGGKSAPENDPECKESASACQEKEGASWTVVSCAHSDRCVRVEPRRLPT